MRGRMYLRTSAADELVTRVLCVLAIVIGLGVVMVLWPLFIAAGGWALAAATTGRLTERRHMVITQLKSKGSTVEAKRLQKGNYRLNRA